MPTPDNSPAAFDSSAFLSTCSGRPGVYRMFDVDAKLLYVGKAKNLKKRLASYFRQSGLAPKTAALVGRIAQIETTITANETEALLLEQTLIKECRRTTFCCATINPIPMCCFPTATSRV